tara:strand:- start:7751 stop:8296 length:546 start_codon:yes stop_codon:yes gene_type:complete
MNKKIAVTGHTRGIGKAVYEAFLPNSVGCSKSIGVGDISTQDGRTSILHQALNCDVFINNAHDGFHQVEMLNTMFKAWQHKEGKHIINIGVDTVPYTDWQVVYRQYPIEKMALHAQAELLQNEKRSCKITTLALGYVDTEFNKDYNGAKLSYDNIINNIKWIVENEAEIKFMILSARGNNE